MAYVLEGMTRVQELGIQPPDPVLLFATLDRYATGLAKNSSQVAFRFAESLLAEGEAVFHGSSSAPVKDTVKVRALDCDGGAPRNDGGKSKDTKDKTEMVKTPRMRARTRMPRPRSLIQSMARGTPDQPEVIAQFADTSCLTQDVKRGRSACSHMIGKAFPNKVGGGERQGQGGCDEGRGGCFVGDGGGFKLNIHSAPCSTI